MSEREQELCVGKTPLHQNRNRNEARVAQIMPSLFGELNLELGSIDIQDVFALARNKLPPHYVQRWPWCSWNWAMRTPFASRCARLSRRCRPAPTTDL